MGRFLEAEKRRQTRFKYESTYFSKSARADGVYRGKARPFCIPHENAEETLFEEFRSPALTYFGKQGINWHDGRDGKPSNHLCDSQVCCVNFLFAFADQPEALKELLLPVYPSIARMLSLEVEGQFVSFEWIGVANYLGEKQELGAQRVSVLHISPDHNTDFRRITSPALREHGKTATEKWKELVRRQDRFISVHTEELFARFPVENYPAMQSWWKYLTRRYSRLTTTA